MIEQVIGARNGGRHWPLATAIAFGLLLGFLVFATAYASIELTRQSGRIAAIWPANAIVLAAILRAPRSASPALLGFGLVGNFAADLLAGDHALTALGFSLCNTGEIVIGLLAFRHFAALFGDGHPKDISSPKTLLVFMLSCGALAPAISAVFAAYLLLLIHAAPFPVSWSIWFMSDAIGYLAVAPVLLSFRSADLRALLGRAKPAEGAVIIAAAVLAALMAFGRDSAELAFLLVPVVLLPAFRFDFAGAALVSGLVIAVAFLATLLGQGPFAPDGAASEREQVLLLQAFALAVTLVALPAAAGLTARRLAEARLTEVSGLMRAILDSADYSIVAARADGLITHFNAAAERMLGYRAGEMVGQATPERFHLAAELQVAADELPASQRGAQPPGFATLAARAAIRPEERDWTYVRKDGSRFPARVSTTTMHGAEGAVTGYLEIAKDVTEQRRLEAELARTRQDLQRILDSMPAMVAYWDRELRNRFCNRAYIEWFGKSPEEIMTGLHIRDVIGPKLFELNKGYMAAALRGEPQRFEREIMDASGRRRFTQAHYIPDWRDGKVHGFYVLVFEISELKEVEAALKIAKEQAETANRAKTAFLSMMSHELRTPLNGILGFTELVAMGLAGPINARQSEYLRIVRTSAEHLLRLISDMLEISMIEAGRISMARESVPLRPVIGTVMASLEPFATRKAVTLVDRLADSDVPPAWADGTRLRQALTNLGSNAIKYNRTGGRVEFSARLVGEGTVRITIADTGPGIPPARQAELFQEFNRLGAEASGIEGTGIGLALTKRLIEAMHGRIGFASVEGKGSEFWVDLPADRGTP